MVTFWDTSAIVPLLVREPGSPAAQHLARKTMLLVWWATPTECLSAIARREREGSLTREEADQARERLRFLREGWSEIVATEEVRQYAARVLLRHPLRAADALQLGAALRWAEGLPQGHRFFTLDTRLGEAARKEGFELVDPGDEKVPEAEEASDAENTKKDLDAEETPGDEVDSGGVEVSNAGGISGPQDAPGADAEESPDDAGGALTS